MKSGYIIDIIRELESGKIRKVGLARSALTFAVSVTEHTSVVSGLLPYVQFIHPPSGETKFFFSLWISRSIPARYLA
jgi:hypothetical protein